jgi:hypothetical protein
MSVNLFLTAHSVTPMDDLVLQAIAKWPNVPSLTGCLSLNMDGEWLLTGHGSEGLTISHERTLNFIARHYLSDAVGRYFFQNGPQKVYVSLAYTPWVYRLMRGDAQGYFLITHTGIATCPLEVFCDELGRVLFKTTMGLGLLHRADVELFSQNLLEAEFAYAHECKWSMPSESFCRQVQMRVALRRDSLALDLDGVQCFDIQSLVSAEVPSRFNFQPDVSL